MEYNVTVAFQTCIIVCTKYLEFIGAYEYIAYVQNTMCILNFIGEIFVRHMLHFIGTCIYRTRQNIGWGDVYTKIGREKLNIGEYHMCNNRHPKCYHKNCETSKFAPHQSLGSYSIVIITYNIAF